MKRLSTCVLAGLLAGVLLAPAARATPFTFTFSATPSGGSITGQPGQLTGWGYDIGNTDTVDWFVPTALSASSFSIGLPDASYFDFPILAPGASASRAFDAATLAGLFGLQVFTFATPGQSDSGVFTLSGEWWDGDPLAGGSLIQAATAVTAPFGVQIPTAPALPVPATALLLATGLGLMGSRGWWQRRACWGRLGWCRSRQSRGRRQWMRQRCGQQR
ncbi:hypothetical protein [Rugamonas brunnea]|uniref:hypothetical protein n=1 Tax=Rugamonas brunnea TaxID=2758569 RepID=UPI0015F3C349|nr:hypothetical protein [Rugamonas brunnea]